MRVRGVSYGSRGIPELGSHPPWPPFQCVSPPPRSGRPGGAVVRLDPIRFTNPKTLPLPPPGPRAREGGSDRLACCRPRLWSGLSF